VLFAGGVVDEIEMSPGREEAAPLPQAEFGYLLCDATKHRTMIGRPGQGVVVHPEDRSL
jgi:hypothetical protein